MRKLSDNEKKLVAIMRRYGKVNTYMDDKNKEYCSIFGNGYVWSYIGSWDNTWKWDKITPMDISPVEETYLALKGVILDMVNRIQDEN